MGSALVQIMACRLGGTKPLSKPMLAYFRLDPWEQTSVNFFFFYQNTNFSIMKMHQKISSVKWAAIFSRDVLMVIFHLSCSRGYFPFWSLMLKSAKVHSQWPTVTHKNKKFCWKATTKLPQYSHEWVPKIAITWHNNTLIWMSDWLSLTNWSRDKMAAIFQTTCSNAFSWMKMFEFWLQFHWTLFSRF